MERAAWRRCTTWLLITATTACGYRSSYVPPDQDRVRVVWQRNRLVTTGPAVVDRCDDQGLVELAPGLSRRPPPEPEPASSLWIGFAQHDDDDDDSELGPLAAILGVVLVSTAVAGVSVGLAFAPAGRPGDNVQVLHAMHMRNAELEQARQQCQQTPSLEHNPS